MRLGRDSMTSFNERGCDEIMCQFIEDIDTTYNIDIEVEEIIEPDNLSSINLENFMQ